MLIVRSVDYFLDSFSGSRLGLNFSTVLSPADEVREGGEVRARQDGERGKSVSE